MYWFNYRKDLGWLVDIRIFQLNMCREEELIFVNFKEGCITFPPTYKFDPGTNTYDTRLTLNFSAPCVDKCH